MTKKKTKKSAPAKGAFAKVLERAERLAVGQGYRVKTEVAIWLAGFVAGMAQVAQARRKR